MIILEKYKTNCCSSVAKSCPTLCSTPGFPVLHCLPEFAQVHVHWISGAIQPSHPLLPSSPAFSLSQHQGLFQWVSCSHQVAKALELQLQHQSFQRTLISFRMDWLDLLAVQGTLKSLLQHHSSKVSILWRSAFFITQLSHPYTTTGKTIALTRWIFVGKVMSLLSNMLSRLVITSLPWCKCLLISWLQWPSKWFWSSKKQKKMKSVLNIFWNDSCWSWNSNTLATWCEQPTQWKNPWCWERLRAGGEEMIEVEMVGWHHPLSGHEFEQSPGDSEGKGSLAYCCPCGLKKLGRT